MSRSVSRLYVFAACCLLLLSTGCTLSGAHFEDGGSSAAGEAIVQTARTQLGKPYKWGGCSPRDGFDCSGYVYWVYQQHGIDVPRNSSGQADAGDEVGRSALRPGDIVVFSPRWQSGLHTGIYSGRGKFLHSPKTGSTIREDKITDSHWADCFVNGRRLVR
ncbi:MAG: C40 family peptidase [Desulfovibrionaceae bacterium]|nr:C40 family peptidase [Desulfovibrionaceae bacterium]